jgi:amino acid transporter
MCVNLAAFWKFGVQQRHRPLGDAFWLTARLPLLGFLFCAAIWWGLATPAKITGSIWLLAGVVVLGVRSNWFREPLRLPDPALYE